MPTYDYRCRKCGHVFELFHSIKDDTPKRCPKCKGRGERVPTSGAGLLFKGSGFYITDYRSDSYKAKAKQDSSGGGGGGSASEGSSAKAPPKTPPSGGSTPSGGA
jgi:putative FmdB family regulatory protein